ncbi:MAG: calcium/sodium antiporter [Lachnospiraceae bacterium]|nr:calcium/sodium antiporter [Lachnospiraceae bacterium]
MNWELITAILLLIVGLVLIIKGGDFFVDAATWMAEVSGVPKLIVGATVVSIATTLPELLVSSMAAWEGSVDMAIGNAIGSVTANTGLILAIGIICIPAIIKRSEYLLRVCLLLGASTLIVVVGSVWGEVGLIASILLIIIFIVAMYDNVHQALIAMRSGKEEKLGPEQKTKKIIIINIVKFVLGAVGIVIGARLLVDNGTTIAQIAGVPERVISVTIIAIGTSLPELVTTITAVVKKQGSLSVGNIIGANIMDMTMIMPICCLISGSSLPVHETVARIDFPACLICGCVAMLPTMFTKKFTRWQGILLLVIYAAYLVITSTAVA